MSASGKPAPGPVSIAISAALLTEVQWQGLKQSDIAELAGISQSQISKFLRGQRILDVEQFVRLCSILSLDAPELVQKALRLPE
jgi:predicted transcriptional regulator